MKKNKFFVMAAIALVPVVLLGGCLSFFGDKVETTIAFDAGSMRNVVRISDDGIDKGWLSVSRDGQKLLYCEQPREFNPDINLEKVSSRIMYLRNASVFAKTPMVESYTYGPAWYENGTNFVYVTVNNDKERTTQLIKSSVSGGGKTFITRNPIGWGDNNPSVRDGIIACDTFINNQRQIVTLRDNGTEITILGPGSQPSWHPTENKLVFSKDGGIWEMDTETTQQTQLHAISDEERADNLWCGSASYTGDGKHIVFVKTAKVGYNTRQHLFAIDIEGNNLTELTSGNTDIWSPTGGPGNQIFFISNAGGKSEIWSALVTLE